MRAKKQLRRIQSNNRIHFAYDFYREFKVSRSMREKVQISLAQHSFSSKAFLRRPETVNFTWLFHADTHGNNSYGIADVAREGCNSQFSLLGFNLKKEEESEGELTA